MENNQMTWRNWLPLIGLTCATFVFNTSEFIPIALLTDIAADFHTTEAHAGMLISVYAWMVMLLSLPLMLAVSKINLRKLLLWVVAAFVLFQVLSSLSQTYYMLMFSRIGVACTHAIFWSIVSPLAVSLVPDSKRPLALSMIVTGTSVAMILGLPIGRMIGLQVGWRMTFMSIAIFSFATLVYLFFTLPQVPSHGGFSVRQLPSLLKKPILIGIYILTLLFSTAYYVGYSYIEPFLLQVAHLSANWVTNTLMLFGVAGIIGSILFSKFYSRNPIRFIAFAIGGICVCQLLLSPVAHARVWIIFLCAAWGMSATAYNVSFQNEIINHTDADATPVAMSISSGIFNLGIATGTLVGGQICTHWSIAYIGYVGGAIALCALFYWCFCLSKRFRA